MEGNEPQHQHQLGEVGHVCPGCKLFFYANCLREHEETLITIVKAWILGLAGTLMVILVHGVLAYQAFEIAHGRAGLGINLNEMITAAGVCVIAILYWAFPKAGK